MDYEQIEQSSTWALAGVEARPWLLMMWMTAWRQVPCGSLPSEESVIAAQIGMPPKMWAKHRDVMMRGWTAADDGRVYHPTLTARVVEMMARRRSDSDRKARERMRKAEGQTPESDGIAGESRVTPAGLPQESSTDNRQPTEQVSKASPSHPPARPDGQKTPTVPCPYEAIVTAYHEILPTLPKVLLRDGKTWIARQKAMRSLWAWVLSSKRPDGTRRAESADDALAWLREYFGRAAENDFLMGRTGRSGEHANWRCDLDFLLTDRGLKQVIEKTQEAA